MTTPVVLAGKTGNDSYDFFWQEPGETEKKIVQTLADLQSLVETEPAFQPTLNEVLGIIEKSGFTLVIDNEEGFITGITLVVGTIVPTISFANF